MSPSRFGQRLPQDQRHVHGRGRKGARPARALGAALLVAVWVLAGLASPALGARSDAFESLQRFFDQVDSYTARFEQVVFDEVGEPIQESRGRLWIQRPNKCRWNYETPYEQQIVSDGERLWVYDKDLQQVTVRKLEGGLLGTPAVLLPGRGRREEQLEIEDIGTEDGLAWVQLTPRSKDSGFESVRIGFENGRLLRLALRDSLGQTTRYVLRSAVENPSIPESRFEFEPPPGVDIVGEQPQGR